MMLRDFDHGWPESGPFRGAESALHRDAVPDFDPKDKSLGGHRERLRSRFLDGGADALPDYELLELILFAASPRGDVKPAAKRLIAEFGSLGNVLAASPADLLRTEGIGPAAAAAIKAAAAAGVRLTRQEASGRPVLNNYRKVVGFCRAAMGREPVEQFRVLYLDKRNRMIDDEIVQRGTVDHTPVYPREVAHGALNRGATAVLLVHNHPSGNPAPSEADIRMTNSLKDALAPIGVVVLDHLIVSAEGDTSFRSLGLL